MKRPSKVPRPGLGLRVRGALVALPPLLGLLSSATPQEPLAANVEAIEHFENHVRPIFLEHCVKCHGGEKAKGGLRLDTTAGIRAGAAGEPIALPGDTEASAIVEAVRHDDPFIAMPPSGKLSDQAITAIERWVELGAIVPDDVQVDARDLVPWNLVPPAELPAELRERIALELSNGVERDWIDIALEARLDAASIEPAAPASKESWLRRVTFDLTGLPPTPLEWHAYQASDGGPDARAAVVDRLLASPAHAERWARRWLDLVRYAETRAHEFDYPIPGAYQYRDYVIRAFEVDVPYDRFITEMLAGDLVQEPRLDPTGHFDESILGTGAWFLGEEVHSPVELREDQCARVAHQVEVISKSVLAMGVACARCHDHKFDPISAEDYHALAGFAISTGARQVRFETDRYNRTLDVELRELLDEHQPAAAEAVAGALEREAIGLADLLSTFPIDLETTPRPRLDGRGWVWDGLVRRSAKEAGDSPIQWFLAPPSQKTGEADPGANARVLIDFGELEGPEWIPNGPGFGTAPYPAGAVLVDLQEKAPGLRRPGDRPELAVTTITAEPAAVSSTFWSDLRLRDATRASRGGSFDWSQAGRTLLTPTFESEHGRVAYLVRGRAKALLVASGHRMIAGPLHKGTIRDIDTKGTWAWIEQSVETAAGLRSRLEFTALGEGVFEIARLVDLGPEDALPPIPQRTDWWRAALDAGDLDVSTPEARAEWLQRSLLDAASLLRTGGVPGRALSDGERASLLGLAEDLAQNHPAVRKSIAAALEPLTAKIEAMRARRALHSATAPAAIDLDGRDEFILHRGSWRSPGAAAPRRAPSALRVAQDPLGQDGKGSGRLALAQSLLASPTKTLQRVWVNRLWQAMFTVGLVATPDDFGAMGAEPTHPEILDQLALDFERDGWSTRRLLRRLALSDAYARSTVATASATAQDPTNALLSRMHVRRLEAEEIRDALLAVSGELDATRFGPSVPIHLTSFMTGRGRPTESGPLDGAGRRSIYLEVRRNFPHPFLTVFDWPTPATCRGRRTSSNVPAQALTLLNDPFVEERAEHLADLVLGNESLSTEARLEALWIRALGRRPTEREHEAWLTHAADSGDARATWVDLAHVLFNVKDFLFLK